MTSKADGLLHGFALADDVRKRAAGFLALVVFLDQFAELRDVFGDFHGADDAPVFLQRVCLIDRCHGLPFVIEIGLLLVQNAFTGAQRFKQCARLLRVEAEDVQNVFIEHVLDVHTLDVPHFPVVNDGFPMLIDGMDAKVDHFENLLIH